MTTIMALTIMAKTITMAMTIWRRDTKPNKNMRASSSISSKAPAGRFDGSRAILVKQT